MRQVTPQRRCTWRVCHTKRCHVQEDKNFNKQSRKTLKTFSGFKNCVHFDTETCQVAPGDKHRCYKDLRSISAVRTANLLQANLHIQKAQ
jgi:hypothetical protein